MRVFYGSHPRTITNHSHPIIQVVVAVSDNFLSKDHLGKWVNKKGLLIAPNFPHECDASNIPIISIEIDPESSLGEWILNNQLKKHAIIDISLTTLDAMDINTFLENLNHKNWSAIRTMIHEAFYLTVDENVSRKDERITNVVEYISENIHQNLNTESLMEVAHLSESRLLHLFKEVMGLPIRNYILWHRLQIVIEMVMQGEPLTAASYQAGFADQAHMTRTFTKMIGIPPSLLTKNSKFVQVSIPH